MYSRSNERVLEAEVGIGPHRKVRSVKIIAKSQPYSSVLCDYSSVFSVCFLLTLSLTVRVPRCWEFFNELMNAAR